MNIDIEFILGQTKLLRVPVLNSTLPFLHIGSLEIMLTVPLKTQWPLCTRYLRVGRMEPVESVNVILLGLQLKTIQVLFSLILLVLQLKTVQVLFSLILHVLQLKTVQVLFSLILLVLQLKTVQVLFSLILHVLQLKTVQVLFSLILLDLQLNTVQVLFSLIFNRVRYWT